MAGTKGKKPSPNEQVILDLLADVDGLRKICQGLISAESALAENLSGRLLKIEQRLEGFGKLLDDAGSGAPDTLARRILGGMLEILERDVREMPTNRQAIARSLLELGRPLMPKKVKPAGLVEKQNVAKDLSRELHHGT